MGGRADVTLTKKRWLLDFAYPAFGDRPIAEITALEVLSVLRQVEARGRYETARRLRSTCGTIFRYAIATGRAERDPSADLRGALTSPKVNHRAAIVDPVGIGALLRAIDGYDGLPMTKAALRLAPLVGWEQPRGQGVPRAHTLPAATCSSSPRATRRHHRRRSTRSSPHRLSPAIRTERFRSRVMPIWCAPSS